MPILNSARELDPARLAAAVMAYHHAVARYEAKPLSAAILAYLQSGPERAAEEMLAACKAVDEVSRSGADTVSLLVELHRVAKLCAAAIAAIAAAQEQKP